MADVSSRTTFPTSQEPERRTASARVEWGWEVGDKHSAAAAAAAGFLFSDHGL